MLALAGLLLAQAAKPLADLPFELIDNHIYVVGSLNGKPVDAILDCGCSTSLVDTALGTSLGAKKLKSFGVLGGGGDPVEAWTVSGLSFTLPGTGIQQSISAMVPLNFADEVAERPFRIALGAEFLKRYRVEIDYAAARLRIDAPGVRDVPPGAEALPLRLIDGLPYVEGEIQFGSEPPLPVTVGIDTGGGGAVTVTNRLVKRLGLDERFARVPELSSGVGLGGEIRIKAVRLGALRLGSLSLSRPVAELQMNEQGMNGSRSKSDVSIGGETLRRFTVTLDYPHKRLMLQPNANFAEPFTGGMFGIGFASTPGGVEARFVVPSSPASEAGIVAGDEVLAVNGRSLTSLQEIRKLTKTPADLRLRIRHAGVEREMVLKPRELVP